MKREQASHLTQGERRTEEAKRPYTGGGLKPLPSAMGKETLPKITLRQAYELMVLLYGDVLKELEKY